MTDTLKYGPQTVEVKALLLRVHKLTDEEVQELGIAWATVPRIPAGEALYAAWYAPEGRGLEDSKRESAWNAARSVVWMIMQGPPLGATMDAILALIMRDQVAPFGFKQKHYDLLTGPWRRVVGKVHPSDELTYPEDEVLF